MTWGVNEIDEVVRSFHGVNHRSRSRVDGDSTSGFLLVKVQHTGCTSEFVGHHARTCDQVVRERGLTVVNVRCNTQVPDLWKNVHDFCCLLDVVFFASHGYHRVLVDSSH